MMSLPREGQPVASRVSRAPLLLEFSSQKEPEALGAGPEGGCACSPSNTDLAPPSVSFKLH